MLLSNGILIAFEGIDGTGKTSIIRVLLERLTKDGFNVVTFKEPTNETEAGKKIRTSYSDGRVSLEDELQWFIDDREWDVKERILPSLAAKKIVLMDRYFFSTACYQGVRMNDDWYSILKTNRSMFPEPDLTIIIDVDPRISQQRILKDRQKSNTFEELDYQRNVRKLFLEIINKDSIGNYLLLDGEAPLDEIIDTLYLRIKQFIKEKEIEK
ncbi:MAG: dTMP kinase [Candidatus Heimdallarchaeota archaeon]